VTSGRPLGAAAALSVAACVVLLVIVFRVELLAAVGSLLAIRLGWLSLRSRSGGPQTERRGAERRTAAAAVYIAWRTRKTTPRGAHHGY